MKNETLPKSHKVRKGREAFAENIQRQNNFCLQLIPIEVRTCTQPDSVATVVASSKCVEFILNATHFEWKEVPRPGTPPPSHRTLTKATES